MASGGYESLLKQKNTVKRDYKQDYNRGRERLISKIGDTVASDIKNQYNTVHPQRRSKNALLKHCWLRGKVGLKLRDY